MVALLLTVALAYAPQPAAAQAPPADPAPAIEDAQIERLLATLQDETARQTLIDNLEALLALRRGAEEEAPVNPTVELLKDQGGALLQELDSVGENLQRVAQVPDGLVELVDEPAERQRVLRGVLEGAVVLLVLLAVRWLTARALRGLRTRLGARGLGASRLRRAGLLLLRLLVDLLPVLATIAAYLALRAAAPLSAPGGVVAAAAIAALAASGFAAVLARAFLAPRTPSLRLFRLADASARHYYRWLMAWVRTLAWGYFAIMALSGLGLAWRARDGLLVLLAAAVAVVAAIFVLRERRPIRQAIRGEGETAPAIAPLRRWLGELWHLLALVAVALFFMLAADDFEGGTLYAVGGAVLTALILVAAHLARVAVDRAGRRLEGHRRWLRAVLGAAHIAIAVLAVALLLEAWGASTLSLLGSEFGQRAADATISIALLVAGAVLVWQVSSRLLERSLRARTDTEGHSVQRSARLRTLLPLMRNGILVVLVIFVAMMVLSELGVDIGPLLAGAGVVGLAIGFGAQTMVQDVITGLFIVVEDQVHIGDVVDVGGHSGVVEGMTIRTLKLRDLAGTLHVVPFSQVKALQNLTKDYAFYVFDVGVAYREDVDEVIEELKRLGQELRADPQYGALMLDDIEVLGLDAFQDSAVVVKARIKTLPIQQWTVGREFNRRMKRRFDEKGIEIPFPHMTLYWGADKKGKAPPAFVRLEAEAGASPDQPPRRRRRRRPAAATAAQRGDDAAASSTGNDD